MMCGLHINQRRKGSLCGSSECTACLPFRKPSEPLMCFTPPTAGSYVDMSDDYPKFFVPERFTGTQLDREVAADRALHIERRVLLAGMAMQALMTNNDVAGNVPAYANLAVTAADAVLTALALTKPPAGGV